MSTTFFCPFCGKQSPDDDSVCISCGKSIRHWREHAFEERLLLTFHHPIREHRMMPVQILGQRQYQRAVPVFAEMIRTERDVYLLREIASALNRIDTAKSRKVLAELSAHPSPVIRSAFKYEEIHGRQGDRP